MQAGDLLKPLGPELSGFRDLGARVHAVSDRRVSGIPAARVEEFRTIQAHPFVIELIESGGLIGSTFVPGPSEGNEADRFAAFVEHPAIEFPSYPYEWPFAALRAAALHHLDVQLSLLDLDMMIAGASAFDIQFQGVRPILTDPLAIRRCDDAAAHWAYGQFCREFLYPLLLTARAGLAFQALYRGNGNGIRPDTLASVLTLVSTLDSRVRKHVLAASKEPGSSPQVMSAFPKSAFVKLLRSLRDWIASLEPKGGRRMQIGPPLDVQGANEQITKFDVLRDFMARVRPGMLLDLHCGSGDYSALALRSGAAAAVGVEANPYEADQAFRRAQRTRRDMLVLTMDVAEPSPAQGFRHAARKSFQERARFDALLAIDVLPQLTIERRIAVEEALPWVLQLAPTGVIEFAPAADLPMSVSDTLNRYEYPEADQFAALLSAHSRIVRRMLISASGRTLFVYDRR
ncbi:MAG: hypothetical protein QOD74_2478 [Variibacter sp.]|jgi:SAM-dependent methyltransferase|nr:hypothetical protein [Variibacter sp.]